MKQYTNGRDNGKAGKNFEVAARMFITPKTKATYAKAARLTDHFIKLNGKRVNIEMKSGAGTLDYNRYGELNTEIPAADHIENIYENADFIIYTPEYDGDAENIGENAWVFTRDEFLNIFRNDNGMVRYNNKAGVTVLQMQGFKNSKKRLNAIWEACLNQPSLADWLTEVRG